MKFYNREKEIKLIKEIENKNIRIAIIGRRRIGKTTLVKEALKNNKKFVFLFVSEESESSLIDKWRKEYSFIPKFDNFYDLFNYLFENFKDKIYFFDEFQNFAKINKAFISHLQQLIDKYNPKIIVTGSIISLSKKIIEDYRSPLFGRFDFIIKLSELSPLIILQIGKDLNKNLEDSFKFWSIFGGIPKYWQLLEKFNFEVKEFINKFFIEYPRPLYNEGLIILKEEFGKEYKTYFSILEAISLGKNSLNEISNFLSRRQNEITKYIDNLIKDFYIIKRIVPFSLKKEKKGIYIFNDNFFYFWFRFLFRNNYLIEENNEKLLKNIVEKEFNSYLGKTFELFIERMLKEKNFLPFQPLKFGRWWYKDKEIDLIAFNEQERKIAFLEAKWQDLKLNDVKRIIKELEEKVEVFYKRTKLNRKELKEYFGIVAKKMDEKAKEWLKENNYLAYELKDFEKN